MAQYAILIYTAAPGGKEELTEDQRKALDAHGAEVESLGGKMLTAFALMPSTTATSVKGDSITDGPFIDAKEVIAGFYVIEARDLDTALAIARRNPAVAMGTALEVRPVESGFAGA